MRWHLLRSIARFPINVFRLHRRAFLCVWEDDIFGFATQMAYHALFSIFPGLLLLAALVQRLGTEDLVEPLISVAAQYLPSEMMGIVRDNMELLLVNRLSGVMTLGSAFILLWVASNFMNVVLKALGVIYRMPDSRSLVVSYFVRRLKALALVVLFGMASALSFNLFVFGGRTARLVETALGIEPKWSTSLELARWPVVVGSMTLAATLLYTIVPFRRVPFRVAWPGALTFGVLWTFATGLFSSYVTGFAHYSSLYGAIAGIIILMSWFYISSLMLLFGAEVNAVWLKLRSVR